MKCHPYQNIKNFYKKISGKNALKIILNIKKLYKNVKRDQKTNVLSLVSNVLSRGLLNKMKFEACQKTYNSAKRKVENDCFNLETYKRFRPEAKRKTNPETINKIIKTLKDFSIKSEDIINEKKVY